MKGTVFVGWTNQNHLAKCLRDKVQSHGYDCIVGGNEDNETGSVYVGTTVISQLQRCNQAVFLIRKNNQQNISNNVMFELGYAFSKFNMTIERVHIFYIDIKEDDSSIPSDLHGAWAYFLSSAEYSENELADIILDIFLKNQKISISENKMDVVNNWHKLLPEIESHIQNPSCSDYELAQYLLFYTQAAHMFGVEDTLSIWLNKLKNDWVSLSDDLKRSITLSQTALDLFMKSRKENNELNLKSSEFHNIERVYNNLLSQINIHALQDSLADKTHQHDELEMWMAVTIYEKLNYTYMIYSQNRTISDSSKEYYYEKSIQTGLSAIDWCNNLIDLNKTTNKEYATLLKAYVYRNIACILEYKGCETSNEYEEYLTKSLHERQTLVDDYRCRNIDTRLYDSFEMEYYLALAEVTNLLNRKNSSQYSMESAEAVYSNLEMMEEYIKKVNISSLNRSYYINRIVGIYQSLISGGNL